MRLWLAFAIVFAVALPAAAQTDTGEIFNVLNTANFDLPNRVFGTPNFGRVFSAKEPREMQFGVKLSF